MSESLPSASALGSSGLKIRFNLQLLVSRYPVQVDSCPGGATPIYGFAVLRQLTLTCVEDGLTLQQLLQV
jgi:hypothetical protein